MSISGALSSAMAGLRVSSKASELIAENISNVSTPGFGRRELALSSTTSNLVGGVTVKGVIRVVDPALISARRISQAEQGYSQAQFDFLSRLENVLGTPDDESALTNQLANFEASLISAASRPDSPERLEGTVLEAGNVAAAINRAADEISAQRAGADKKIDAQVTRLNDALKEVEHLNSQIARFQVNGHQTSALYDMRQNVIDEINVLVPVREVPRDNGQVALFSEGGVILVDGPAAEVSFTPVHTVTPYMSLAANTLSGLEVNGRPVDITRDNGGFSGGAIAAQFKVRDELGPEAQVQLDAMARDLVERYQDPAVDPTLLPGEAGLFTDDGVAFDPADEVGLASRLQLNAAVDPAQGGESWRMRDGIAAGAPGSVGQSAGLDRLREALLAQRAPASGNFGTGDQTAGQIAGSLMGQLSVQRLSSEQKLSFANAEFAEMQQAELAQGVDTDTELRNMMLVERSYAANAKMMQTIDEMMMLLLRMN